MEDKALKDLHPRYREWEREEPIEEEDELTRAEFEREIREGR